MVKIVKPGPQPVTDEKWGIDVVADCCLSMEGGPLKIVHNQTYTVTADRVKPTPRHHLKTPIHP